MWNSPPKRRTRSCIPRSPRELAWVISLSVIPFPLSLTLRRKFLAFSFKLMLTLVAEAGQLGKLWVDRDKAAIPRQGRDAIGGVFERLDETLMPQWDVYRVPLVFRLVKPKGSAGHQSENTLFREIIEHSVHCDLSRL
jgi:hypothetical protein